MRFFQYTRFAITSAFTFFIIDRPPRREKGQHCHTRANYNRRGLADAYRLSPPITPLATPLHVYFQRIFFRRSFSTAANKNALVSGTASVTSTYE